MIPARPFVIALLLSASAGGANAADDPDKGWVACVEKGRQADATCSKLTDEPAQRLECFQKARAEQLGCLEHALSDAPTGATAPVSSPEPSRQAAPGEQPSMTSEPPSQANPHENAGQPAENTQANSPASPPAEPQMSTQETAPKTTQDNAATNAPPLGKPAVKPEDTAPSRKRAENRPRERSAGPPGCTHFRSYNAASSTYRDFDGRTRPCQ